MAFIGVDGGGSKTSVAIVDSEGNVLATANSGGTNWNSVGREVAKKCLFEGIENVLKAAGKTVPDVRGICLGMSGVDRPADKVLVTEWMKELLPTANVAIHNDGVVALAGGTRGKLFGVVVISGTGTISLGFNAQGDTQRAGGWGPLLGDEGSGYAIALDALRAVACMKCTQDGRGPETTLSKAILTHLDLPDTDALLAWCYSDLAWVRFAALAPLVSQCANSGDTVAAQILSHAADALASTIGAVVRNLNLPPTEPFPLVFAGGNLTHEGSRLAAQLTERLQKTYPQVQILQPQVSAEVAAALLAKNL